MRAYAIRMQGGLFNIEGALRVSNHVGRKAVGEPLGRGATKSILGRKGFRSKPLTGRLVRLTSNHCKKPTPGAKEAESLTDPSLPKGAETFRGEAERLAKDPTAMAKLLDAAHQKAQTQSARLTKIKADFANLLRLLKAYAKGEYRRVPWTSLVTAVLAVVYFVNPFDVIPDFIAGVGYLDDATVIAFCLNGIRGDLTKFAQWEASGKPGADVPAEPKPEA